MHSRIQHEIEPSAMCPSCIFWHVKDFGAARDGDADGLKSLPMDIRCTHEWPDVFKIPAEIETFHNRVSIAC